MQINPRHYTIEADFGKFSGCHFRYKGTISGYDVDADITDSVAWAKSRADSKAEQDAHPAEPRVRIDPSMPGSHLTITKSSKNVFTGTEIESINLTRAKAISGSPDVEIEGNVEVHMTGAGQTRATLWYWRRSGKTVVKIVLSNGTRISGTVDARFTAL